MIHGWNRSRLSGLALASLVPFLAPTAHADVQEVIYDQGIVDFTMPSTGKCSLKRFSQTSYDDGMVGVQGDHSQKSRGTMVGTVTETSDASCIHDYAVVQYIHGCVYDIEQNDKTGQLERYYGTLIDDSNGKTIPFKFDQWTVDSVDPDPMYYSSAAKKISDPKRFDGQYYAKRPLILDGTKKGLDADRDTFFNSKYAGIVKNLKTHPARMHSLDLPVTSSWYGYTTGRNVVQTASLEFKTCLYLTKDVPLKGAPKGFNIPAAKGGPLHCFDWSSRNEFDFVTKSFVPKTTIDPFCSTPVPPDATTASRD